MAPMPVTALKSVPTIKNTLAQKTALAQKANAATKHVQWKNTTATKTAKNTKK